LADASLAGYGWTGPELCDELPEQTHTFAVRLGEQTRGQGLATPFNRAIVMGSMVIFGGRDIGLQTWGRNRPAVCSYLKAGPLLADTVYDEKEHDSRLTMYFPDTFMSQAT
jgi:hypothetical protein